MSAVPAIPKIIIIVTTKPTEILNNTALYLRILRCIFRTVRLLLE